MASGGAKVREFTAELVVRSRKEVAEGVLTLDLADPQDNDLPGWEPGAHIDLILDEGLTRQYSLCGDPRDDEVWRVGVLLDPESRGGSRHVHEQLSEGALDFSYAPVLHSADLPPGMDRLPPAADVEVSETSVSYTRELPEAPLAPWEADSTELDADRSYARQERGTFASPAMHVQRWQLQALETDAHWYIHERIHAITPETDTSTHVFMQVSRNYRPPSDAADKAFRAFIDGLVERDVGVLEMIAARGGYDSWQSGVEFVADAAVLRARRIVRVMLGNEGVRLRSGQPKVKRSEVL
jgi:hypothetical protein